MKYQIIRFYESGGQRTIKRNLSLSKAQAHCKDPETSSSTCSARTKLVEFAKTSEPNDWFDGYTEQTNKESN